MTQDFIAQVPAFSSPDAASVSRSLSHSHSRSQSNSLALDQIVPMLIGSTVEAIERELVLQTLAHCDGNRTHASRVLGMSLRTLRNKIRQYAIDGVEVPAHS
jgi:DNA-binding NtrC family response regulator